MIQGDYKWDGQRNDHLHRESKITPTVDVIKIYKISKLRRDDDSVIKVALSVKMTGTKRRGNPGYGEGKEKQAQR